MVSNLKKITKFPFPEGESRDSGVSENHSRQSSGPFSVEEIHETPTFKSSPTHSMPFDEETRLKNIEKKISEQEVKKNQKSFHDKNA